MPPPHGRGPYPSKRNRPPGPVQPGQQSRQIADVVDDEIGVRLERAALRRTRQNRDGDGAGRSRAVEVVPQVADHDDLRRVGLEEARESQRHPRIRLSPVDPNRSQRPGR